MKLRAIKDKINNTPELKEAQDELDCANLVKAFDPMRSTAAEAEALKACRTAQLIEENRIKKEIR